MDIRNISCNAVAYIFDNIESYLTNVFIIEGESKIFIIDTFCGSEYMGPIIDILDRHSDSKEIIVINTHFHWDHVWGNCSFGGKNIISHLLCRQLMDEFWESEIIKNGKYISGKAEKYLPNITFKDNLIFHKEGIELFHSPGHTADSISIFDHNERILYVGDNMEKPIIYVENADIDTYIKTLESYLNYKPKKIVAGHTLDLTEEDIFSTVEYLKGLSNGKEMQFNTEYERNIHDQNSRLLNKAY